MPVPIPGPEVGSDSLKFKFLMIFGRPKTGFFDQISGAPGYIPPIPASYQPRSKSCSCWISELTFEAGDGTSMAGNPMGLKPW